MGNTKSTGFVDECYTRYEKDFQDDWIEESLEWDTIDNAQKSFRTGRDKMNLFALFCFLNIAKSLLGGEYIVSREKFDEVKANFQKYWDNEHLCPDMPGVDDEIIGIKQRLYRLYGLMDAHLKALFSSYTSFVVAVDEKLDYGKHVYLFKVETREPESTKGFRFFDYLRKLIIPLCEMEHYLEFSEETRGRVAVWIEQLKLISNEETDEGVKKVLSLAGHKARFMLKKLLREEDSFEVLVDCENKKVSRRSIGDLPEPLTYAFTCYERVHENKPYSEEEIHDIQIRLTERKDTFWDMVLLMDYYCTTDKSLMQIDNLLDCFEQKYQKLYRCRFHFAFDNHSICTLRNFMYNCRLAYKVRQDGYSVADLEADIERIKQLQSETFVNNFYPYKKAIDFLDNLIRKNINDRNLKFDYGKAISLYERYLSRFDANIEWCAAHKFYPIQLSNKECKIKVGDEILFIPSTITRPIDYKKLREIQAGYHSSLDYFKTSQISLKDREDAESIKDELRGIEKRYLEIGSILVGVVTFLFGTINIFTQSDATPQEMFRSILGLGLVLVIFACLIVIATERFWSDKHTSGRVTICGIIIGIYTTIIAVLAFSPKFPSHENVDEGTVVTDTIGNASDNTKRTDPIKLNQSKKAVEISQPKN